mmetsp:Transcript_28985/g.69867  ORF Transcript_28985/g.69867 Transcript_28985/m.69867 type:complete len:251 (+) Transcript_28985:251-1003(+)
MRQYLESRSIHRVPFRARCRTPHERRAPSTIRREGPSVDRARRSDRLVPPTIRQALRVQGARSGEYLAKVRPVGFGPRTARAVPSVHGGWQGRDIDLRHPLEVRHYHRQPPRISFSVQYDRDALRRDGDVEPRRHVPRDMSPERAREQGRRGRMRQGHRTENSQRSESASQGGGMGEDRARARLLGVQPVPYLPVPQRAGHDRACGGVPTTSDDEVAGGGLHRIAGDEVGGYDGIRKLPRGLAPGARRGG